MTLVFVKYIRARIVIIDSSFPHIPPLITPHLFVSMTTAAENKVETHKEVVYECPACLTDYNESQNVIPHLFPCHGGHSFCGVCLTFMLETANPTCPICQQPAIHKHVAMNCLAKDVLFGKKPSVSKTHWNDQDLVAAEHAPLERKLVPNKSSCEGYHLPLRNDMKPGSKIKIVVKMLDGCKKVVQVQEGRTVLFLKKELAHSTAHKQEQIRLIYRGQPLADEQPITVIKPNTVVHMIMQFRRDIGIFEEWDHEQMIYPTLPVNRHGQVMDLGSLLSPSTCEAWVEEILSDSKAHDHHDLKMTVSIEKCLKWIGSEKWTSLLRLIPDDFKPDRAICRVVQTNLGKGIHWHLDQEARATVQICLNAAYTGGHTTYLQSNGQITTPKRQPGSAIWHNDQIWHCVPPVTSGQRVSVFLLQSK